MLLTRDEKIDRMLDLYPTIMTLCTRLEKAEAELMETEDKLKERIRELAWQLHIAYTERTESKTELAEVKADLEALRFLHTNGM